MNRAEPTNNIAPRLLGLKIKGSIQQDNIFNETAVIRCDVTAYPVPVFKYVLSFLVTNCFCFRGNEAHYTSLRNVRLYEVPPPFATGIITSFYPLMTYLPSARIFQTAEK